MSKGVATYVDRGGTFTDVVTVDDSGRAVLRKVPSDRAVVGELAEGALRFGTTVATNALLERNGARTLLVVTRGFRDLVSIGDMTRPGLFEPDRVRTTSLATDTVEVIGRISSAGTELEGLVKPLFELDEFEAVAVVLINSPRNPAHELALERQIRVRNHSGIVAGSHLFHQLYHVG